MCGIAGVFGQRAGRMEGILEGLDHRGPDARDVLRLPGVGGVLGHTRLSIIDPGPRSHQPFTVDDGRYAMVYNGEIYNYRALRNDLIERGVQLRTQSDTEVLLIWFVRRGVQGIKDLDGMFAFGVVDRKTQRLWLVRDRIGEKPLYYASTSEPSGVAFCSEMGGLIDLPGVDRSLDHEALRDYLRFLYTPAPATLYSGIRELEPGCVMTVDLRDHTVELERYYDLEDAAESREVPGAPECYERFRCVFDRALERRLEADVPLCVYFSGGVDSSLMLRGILDASGAPGVEAFTVRYVGSRQSSAGDESGPARRLASGWGVGHTLVDFSPEFPFREAVERVVDLFCHPFGNSTAVVSDVLAREVAKNYKVTLAGDGGDELTGGYPRYRALLLKEYVDWMGPLPGILGRLCLLASSLWPRMLALGRRLNFLDEGVGREPARAFLRWSTYMSQDEVARATGDPDGSTRFQERLTRLFRRNSDNLLRAASLVDYHSFVPHNLLRSADRTGMAHSLEVRVPFLSPDVVETALSLGASERFGWTEPKRLFRKAFGDRIPEWVWNRRKMPFNPPLHAYLTRHVSELEQLVTGPNARLGEVIDPDFVSDQLSDFKARRRENATLLWGLATLEAWLRRN